MTADLKLSKSAYFVLRSLLTGPKSYWELLLEQETSGRNFIPELRKLLEEELVTQDPSTRKFILTEKGKEFALSHISTPEVVYCPHCKGRGIVLSGRFKDLLHEFKKIASNRPRAIPEYDQGYVEEEVTILRVAYTYLKGDLEGKEILIIGDDDLTGIAMAISGLPKKVMVLEADERIVEYTNQVAKERGLNNLSAEIFDVRDPLPEKHRNAYDTFITDPVETLEGFSLFISRGVAGLRGEGASGYFGLSYVESSFRKWHQLHRRLYDMNLVITDILPHFQHYALNPDDIMNKGYRIVDRLGVEVNYPDVNWYNSAFHRVELVGDPKPHYPADQRIDLGRELYFDDEAYVTLY